MSASAIIAPEQLRDDWLEIVASFCEQVADWARRQNWEVTEKPHQVTEEDLGTYPVPLLIIQLPKAAVMVEPIARDVLGAAGRIDLYAYPTLFRVMLLRSQRDHQWVIMTDSGVPIRKPWDEETFVELVGDLTAD